MISTILLSVLLGSSLCLGAPQPIRREEAPHGRVCGVHISAERIAAAERLYKSSRLPSIGENATATIDIHFHVIAANQTLEGGWLPDNQIKDQIDVLKKDYASTGLSWNHVNTSRILSQEWFEKVAPESPENSAMKQVFRVGNASILNIYSVGFVSNPKTKGLLGYSTFPADYEGAPKDDGVVIRYSTVPGGSTPMFNLGRTLTHEVGHWLGLYHTFQGGCTDPGDSVADTVPEESAANGCPEKRSTCPGGKADPVNNFMDYTDDSCMTGFTPGQATRIKDQIRLFRSIDLS